MSLYESEDELGVAGEPVPDEQMAIGYCDEADRITDHVLAIYGAHVEVKIEGGDPRTVAWFDDPQSAVPAERSELWYAIQVKARALLLRHCLAADDTARAAGCAIVLGRLCAEALADRHEHYFRAGAGKRFGGFKGAPSSETGSQRNELIRAIRARLAEGPIDNKTAFADELGITRQYLHKLLKEIDQF